jgi:hypothetical protein
MTTSEEQKFRIAKTEGFVTDDLDGMTSQEIYALVRTRIGAERASAILIELEQKGCASVLYPKSFGNKARLDIQKVA